MAPNLELLENLKCKYCNKHFSKTFNLKRHYNRCKEKKKEDDLLKEELFNLLLENQKKQEEKQNNYEMRIEKLQEQISKLNTGIVNYNIHHKIENNNIHNNNIQNNNIQNIQVLAYDKTDITHLKDRDYKKVLRRGNFCVQNFVDAIHFNPKKQ